MKIPGVLSICLTLLLFSGCAGKPKEITVHSLYTPCLEARLLPDVSLAPDDLCSDYNSDAIILKVKNLQANVRALMTEVTCYRGQTQ